MSKTRVAVLRGGPSSEYEVSLKTGATVLKHIPQDAYVVQDILISKEGIWHRNGVPVTIDQALSHADVVFNALHGAYGEDGKLQHILELYKIPFTGSGSFASAIGMNKVLTKDVFKKEGIKTPQSKTASAKDKNQDKKIAELFKSFSLPVIIKPITGGSSIGVTLVQDFKSFEKALDEALSSGGEVLIEEYIVGKEATVGVIEGYRGEEYYALPAIEIQPKGRAFFDYEAKYQGQSLEIVPGNFTSKEKKELEDLARKIHKALGLKHYSRSDFIVTPRRGIFALEVNTLPGLTEESLVPKALNSVGASMSHFLDHILQLALRDK